VVGGSQFVKPKSADTCHVRGSESTIMVSSRVSDSQGRTLTVAFHEAVRTGDLSSPTWERAVLTMSVAVSWGEGITDVMGMASVKAALVERQAA
jgi:hypothetical protein